MKWFYADSGRQIGPLEESALDDLVRTGVVRDETLVWREGLPSWQPHAAVRGSAHMAPPPAVAVGAGETRYCSECGRPFPLNQVVMIGSASVCANCKPLYLQRMREGAGPGIGARHYGGFWMRFLARLIDGVLLAVISIAISLGMRVVVPLNGGAIGLAFIAVELVLVLVQIVIAVIYEGYFVSTRGGTIGKLVLGLRIIRSDGGPVSFGLAVGRYFAQWISGMILAIGYIMAGFDPEKRALHDRICDTRVIYAAAR